MTGPRPDDPLAALAADLGALHDDALGIHALAVEIDGLLAAERRHALLRLRATIAASMIFAGTAATSAAIGLGHTDPGACCIGVIAGLAAGTSCIVMAPCPKILRHIRRRWAR